MWSFLFCISRRILSGISYKGERDGRDVRRAWWRKECKQALVRKLNERYHLEYGWKYHIKMVFEEIRWNYLKWIHLAQDRDNRRTLVEKVKGFCKMRGIY